MRFVCIHIILNEEPSHGISSSIDEKTSAFGFEARKLAGTQAATFICQRNCWLGPEFEESVQSSYFCIMITGITPIVVFLIDIPCSAERKW